MKRNETFRNRTDAKSNSRRHSYHKTLDNRKHPVRGPWRRNGKFLARITVEADDGKKDVRWVTLPAKSAAEAHEEFRKLLVERSENRLRHVGRSPTFAEFYDTSYEPALAASGKKPDTITTEKSHYKRWREVLGHLRLDKVRPSHIQDALNKLRVIRSPRTCNVALVCLRHVLKAAKRDGYLKTLPVENIAWQRTETKARHVDFNPALEMHLRDMLSRRAPDSQWLFPSPQRGERDEHAKTFRESLILARQAAELNGFGSHDCRHHFISYSVMSGIDYMTIARWVGRKDGGVLIGKVYGHLCNKHTQAQALRLNFGPTVLPAPALPALAANAR